MVRYILLTMVVIVNGYFAPVFIRDLLKHKQEFKEEPADSKWLALSSFIIFFLSTFGISDFAIGTVLYQKAKWVSMKKLPGTINTECVITEAVMDFSTIIGLPTNIKNLFVCILC